MWELWPRHAFPRGLSHTCIPPPPSLVSPGLGFLHSAGAQPQCELWMERSGSRGPGGGRPPCWYPALQSRLRMEQTGSCTGQNTVCCELSLCRIRLLSHAVGVTESRKIRQTVAAILSDLIYLWGWKQQQHCVNLTPSQLILHESLKELYE